MRGLPLHALISWLDTDSISWNNPGTRTSNVTATTSSSSLTSTRKTRSISITGGQTSLGRPVRSTCDNLRGVWGSMFEKWVCDHWERREEIRNLALKIHEAQDFNILVTLVPDSISPTARTGIKCSICIFGVLVFLLVFVNCGDSAFPRSVNSPSIAISTREISGCRRS